MIPAPLKKWCAFGSGIGIEIAGPHGSESLHITAVRVRPNGARVLSRLDIEDFPHQPAGVWGTEYANFARKLGLRHVGATVILPRRDVIVRQLSLPGVADKDLAAAVGFQLDGLHPYPEDEIVASWSRLGNTSAVVVAIVRRAAVERYATLFAEAGIKTACFTCSATAIYSALRLFNAPLPAEILAVEHSGGDIEVYGESPTRFLFSASFPLNPARQSGDSANADSAQSAVARAAELACAELRIHSSNGSSSGSPDGLPVEPRPLDEMLHAAPPLPYAAALASACPRLSLALNLLPAEQRHSSSRALWIPTAALGAIVLMLAGALAAFPGYENRKYLRSLEVQIAKVQPLANRAETLDRSTNAARIRAQQLDDFRRRAKSDMDVIEEMTHILPPPTWLTMLEISRTQVVIAGDTDQAAPLLKTIDASPLFTKSSEFIMPPVRTQTGEMFRIRTTREPNREGAR
jgi:hypothetical protein